MPRRDGLYLHNTEGGKNEEPPVIRENLNTFKQIPGKELLLEVSLLDLQAVLSQI